jgi:hypothetical protein
MNMRSAASIPERLRFQPKQLSILSTVVALVLWAVSIARANLVLDDWGLIHSLPVIYFLGVGFLTLAAGILWLSKESHNFLMGFQLCFFIAMLWATPLLLGTTLVATRLEFGYYSNTQYILSYFHLNIVTQWLHNWPGFSLFSAGLAEVIGLKNADTMLICMPLIMQFLMVIPFFLFFRNLVNKNNYSWAALWIFYLFDHVGTLYFGNQAIAYFLLFIVFAMLLQYYDRANNEGSASCQIVIVILLSGLAVTHLLTALCCLFVIATLWIFRKYRVGTLLMLFGSVIAAWTVFVTTGYFEGYTPKVLDNFFRIDRLFQVNVSRLINQGSAIHKIVAKIRTGITVLAGGIGFGGFLLSRKFKSDSNLTAITIAGGILLMLPFGFYSGEMITRTYLFILPVLVFFGVKLLKTKIIACLFIILLIVTIPLSIVVIHGNEAVENITSSQRSYWHFITDKTTQGYFTGGGMIWGWSLEYAGEQYYDPVITAPPVQSAYSWRDAVYAGQWPPQGINGYIALSAYEEAMYKITAGDNNFVPELRSWFNYSTNYNLIFNSGDVTAYMHEVIWASN